MPRGVKAEVPVDAESFESEIQANNIIVLHPGSTTLWLGRATDHLPTSYHHVVAWRLPEGCANGPSIHMVERDGIHHSDSETQRELALSVVEQAIWSRKCNLGNSRKQHVPATQVATYNANVEAELLDEEESSVEWSDVSQKPSCLTGEQALYIDPQEPYTLLWPMKHGRLNLHKGPGGSLTSICIAIEAIWSRAIQTCLKIPLKDLTLYRAVLVVPDSFAKNHIKEMVKILINGLGFSSVILQQESVSSTFGCGLSSACVVDVGDEKTSICCVEDGLIVPSSRLWLNYGGRDITHCFYWLMKRVNFPYKECDVNNMLDAIMLQELKETFCHLSQEIVGGRVHEFQVHHPRRAPIAYNLKIGDEAMQAPMAMFFPQLFGIVGQQLLFTADPAYDDPEDLLDDRYLLDSQRGDASSKKGGQMNDSVTENDNGNAGTPVMSHGARHRNTAPAASQALDQAIITSIECCSTEDTKRKMYSSILLIGGGFNFNGAAGVLQARVQSKLPQYFRKMVDQVEVTAKPKEMDPRTVAWKGGAILSILDSAQELWLTEREWNVIGVRALREKSPFVWSTA
ncbi:actin-related protein 8 isoform X1 [Nematostella vectensis]|uniref:actin-related protein 8 isoform X1 n=1 Tax=Nematostella vectensis TaxID=45351 RepID=UPI0020771457|nr:actin-related protein 8 isoform X1 [Nematostella vectensis]